MTTARQIVADTHQRLLAERLRIRRMLLNITTVESDIYRGARVNLHKTENPNHARPHSLFFFSVVVGSKKWESRVWYQLLTPTKVSVASARAFREEAITETINYLLSLPEREPPRCPACGSVVKRKCVTAKFCSDRCYKAYGSKAQAKRRKRGA